MTLNTIVSVVNIDIMSNGHNINGGSNGHFNHVDPTRGQCFFSVVNVSQILAEYFIHNAPKSY